MESSSQGLLAMTDRSPLTQLAMTAILEAMRIDKLQADELTVDVFKCALAHFQFASHATS
jgi:hypothetical protein